jgi:hypothetical protein
VVGLCITKQYGEISNHVQYVRTWYEVPDRPMFISVCMFDLSLWIYLLLFWYKSIAGVFVQLVWKASDLVADYINYIDIGG